MKTKHGNLHIFPLGIYYSTFKLIVIIWKFDLTHTRIDFFKYPVDVTNYASYDDLAKQIGEIVQDDGLNVLFNNAGVAPKSTRLTATKQKDLMDTFETNSVAPVMLTKVSELTTVFIPCYTC